jgi:hypothetical protein
MKPWRLLAVVALAVAVGLVLSQIIEVRIEGVDTT